ncbi:MAG: MBL fold metallo-hydrolase [Rhodobiaceae bacterium]|nr:MBL fold metallo-hydrolase [Rhodobiaceae bacterium]MCC0053492.1 MBL fold metallo-hydrolase [Rhodobiaceae bacterium]
MAALREPLVFGDTRVDRIVELVKDYYPAMEFFRGLTPEILDEHRHWLEPDFIHPGNGNVILTFQSYLVRTPRHTILVDSCIGNDKPRPTRQMFHMLKLDAWQRNLAALGLTVADIDFVMCTHLHVDHVGWNTRLENGRWVPTFPNARYIFSGKELDFWSERERQAPETCPWITDSVLPVVAAGCHQCVTSDHAFDDHMRLTPTPGHTIDHFSVELGGMEPDAIIGGDMVHSPIQVLYPEIGMFSDFDSKQAGETRHALFSRLLGTPTKLCTAHFAEPSVIRITGEKGGGYDWAYA